MNKRVLIWLAVIAIFGALLLAVTTPAAAVLKKVDGSELTQLQDSGAMVVDVRSASEYASGHIPGASNVPLEQLQQAAATWSKDRAVVVYCATGARSANAAAYLAGQGFRKVYDLTNGMVAWTGSVQGGAGGVPSGPGTVKTSGKPVFIDFSSST